MDIIEFLRQFETDNCACKRTHKLVVQDVIIEKNATERLPELISKYNSKKPFILADKNTFSACGKKVLSVLEKASIKYSYYVFANGEVAPNEQSVGSAIMHFDASCDLVIGVGSGVINDVGKIVASTTKLPYFIVGTAPSMDGYASETSSMAMDGLKVSLPSKCANVIIGDIDILKNAPMKMLQAGLGDMLAKFISIAEWRIASEITGEYYCEKIAELIRGAVKRCVENAKGLLERDEQAVKAVFEGLVIGGVAMAFAGVSRPASGVEHYFSHVWDMRSLEFNTKEELHGLQCAVATNIVAGLYEKVLKLNPNKESALEYARSFDYDSWANCLRKYLGKSAETMILLEEKERKYDREKHAERLDIIIDKWDKVCQIIREEIPQKKEIEKILDIIGAPKTVEELGIECDLSLTLKATKDIRDKYVLSRLLWDIGIIDNFNF